MRSHIARSKCSAPSGGCVRGSRLAQPAMPHISLEQCEIREDIYVEQFHLAVFLHEIIIESFGSYDVNGDALGDCEFCVTVLNSGNVVGVRFGEGHTFADALAILRAMKCIGRKT